jgi:hypothetical protein
MLVFLTGLVACCSFETAGLNFSRLDGEMVDVLMTYQYQNMQALDSIVKGQLLQAN